jgi:xylulokinase
MAVDVVVGIDVGTQSSKLVACDAGGAILAEERIAHGVSRPAPGHFEQDAEAVWWHDVVALLRRFSGRDQLKARALCVSAIGPTALPTDAAGAPLRPGILYGIDMRARQEIAEMNERLGARAAIEICGSALSTQSPVPKLLWLKAHEPDVFRRMERWFTAHSWLIHQLCGAHVVDHHSASQAAPLYDVPNARWREDLWAEVLPGVAAPALTWPGAQVGVVGEEAARVTGLAAGTPVVMGTIDAWAEAYSVYADEPGTTMIMYGSTFFFIAEAPHFVPSDKFWGTRSVRRDSFSLAGGMSTGGLVLDWLARLFGTDVATVLAAGLAGGGGPTPLLALPYLSGERTPFADPDVRATLFGMDLDTGRDGVCRAFLQGLALAVRDNLDALGAEIGGNDYVAVGGGANSPGLLQLISNAAGIAQTVPERTVGAALGDARLAAEFLGWDTGRERWNPPAHVVQPAAGSRAAFDPAFARFKELYRSTRHLQAGGGAPHPA